LSAEAALEWLVGMQAQEPGDPYVGLWTRLEGFRPEELGTLMTERRAVRTSLMRTTIHLVTARDALALHPLLQPVHERAFRTGTPFGRQLAGVDHDALVAVGRELLEAKPRTLAQLRPLLAKQWPDRDPSSLAYAVRYLLPLVQVTPRGVWGASGQATWTTVRSWLGRVESSGLSPDELVLRYLRAFGPASPADLRAWSWISGLREVFERLRPTLRVFRDERNRALFDVPDAPRPDPDQPAPVRFLPQYDNVLLGHADRTRIVSDADRRRVLEIAIRGGYGSVLVDGFARAMWTVEGGDGKALVSVTPVGELSKAERAAVGEEAARLAAFLEPGRTADVRIAPVA